MNLPRPRRLHLVLCSVAAVLTVALPYVASAATEPPTTPGDFSLQVTPSPLVTTVKPGYQTELELRIRNAGNASEDLKIESRSFKLDSASGQIVLDDTSPPDIGQWVTFSNPTFTVASGQWFTEKVRVNLPKQTGFSYAFALVISRKNNPQPISGGRLIKGSLADFTLVNVDRPGATRKLEVPKFVTSKGVYEYLPADLKVTFKNSGNSIVQPYGNIFVGRSGNTTSPLATLAVNSTHGYILPGTSRTLTTSWADSFPIYKTTTASDGSSKTKLQWNWTKLSQFRLGRYTAKLIAVYDDGTRDVPIERSVNFWVFPWKILLGLFVVLLLVLFGLWSFVRKIIKIGRRITGHKKPQNTPKTPKAD